MCVRCTQCSPHFGSTLIRVALYWVRSTVALFTYSWDSCEQQQVASAFFNHNGLRRILSFNNQKIIQLWWTKYTVQRLIIIFFHLVAPFASRWNRTICGARIFVCFDARAADVQSTFIWSQCIQVTFAKHSEEQIYSTAHHWRNHWPLTDCIRPAIVWRSQNDKMSWASVVSTRYSNMIGMGLGAGSRQIMPT